MLEDEAVEALAIIKKANPPEYQRKRAALKQANRKVSLTALDDGVKSWTIMANSAPTHHGYATSLLVSLTVGDWPPVGFQGELYVVNSDTAIWECKPLEILIRLVAEMHDGKEHCSRRADYRSIAEHAISLASNNLYFPEGPAGLACPGGFYQIVGEKIEVVPLTPDHRQRVMLPFDPEPMQTPMFDDFLHQTFKSDFKGEEQQQIALMQEIAGSIMLGLTYKYQFAILFYEPFGRAGKGTIEKLWRVHATVKI